MTPDVSQPAPSPTTETRTRNSKTGSSADRAAAPKGEAQRTAHFVLQGKGGVGKTLIASYLTQFLAEHDRLAAAFDTDPVNGSLQSIPALKAQPVELLNGNALNLRGVDRLVEAIVAADGDVVVDNGAASFVPMARYMAEQEIASVLAEHRVATILHTIVTGGPGGLDTLKGLAALVETFTPAAQVVVWVNDYFGPARYRDTDFEHTTVYTENRGRLRGVIHLRSPDPEMGASNLADMLNHRLTFAEVAASPEFMLMEKSRLARIKRDLWGQLAEVV